MARMNGSSPKRRSRALNSRPMGWEGRGAHRGFYGGVRGVRKSSESGVDGSGDLERRRRYGEG